MILAWWLAWAAWAADDDPSRFTGLPVASVQLVAVRGSLPDDDVAPLLRVAQGEPLDPAAVRDDLQTLFRLGEFAAVEARAEPWFLIGADGNVPAVQITYEVIPAPRVTRLRVRGVWGLRREHARTALGVTLGDVFYPDVDVGPAQARVRADLLDRGFPSAAAVVVPREEEPGALTLDVEVTPGAPRIARDVRFTGTPTVRAATLRAWAARAGVREGRPVSEADIVAATQSVRDHLRDLRRQPFRDVRGFLDATVGPGITTREDGVDVTFAVTAGTPTRLEVRGYGLRGRARAIRVLGIDQRLRLIPSFTTTAAERITDDLAARGRLAPRVDVRLDDGPGGPDGRVLRVDVHRGPRWRTRRPVVVGHAAVDAAALRAAIVQSSDTLRRGWYDPAAVDDAITAVRDLYNARGRPDAIVTLVSPVDPDTGRAHRRPDDRRVRLTLDVVEGRYLAVGEVRLLWTDDRPHPDLSALTATLPAWTGRPWSPGALDAFARDVRAACADAGWLDAEVRLRTREEGGDVDVDVVIDAGDPVRLRAVVLRGLRTARRPFVYRQADLTRGELLGADDLEAARRRLYDLGIFRSVTAEVVGDGDSRDVVLTFAERPRWTLDLGGGVNTDQGIRLFSNVSRYDLWGLAHRLDLRAQVGLDWVVPDPAAATRGPIVSPEWRVTLAYTAPHFPSSNQRLRFDVLLRERQQERTWSMARYGLGAVLETVWPAARGGTTLRVDARWELRRLLSATEGALLDGEAWSLLGAGLDPSAASAWRPQETLTVSVVHDRRDDPVLPRRGWLLSTRGQWSPGITLAADPLPQSRFLLGDVGVSGWIPTGGPVLRLTAEGGAAWAYDGTVLPLEDRFRLGGTGSFRGIPRDGVGPHNRLDRPVPGPAIDGALPAAASWVPTGGDAYTRAIVELALPLPLFGLDGWDGYFLNLFADVGNVWLLGRQADSDADAARRQWSPPLRASVGLGPRVSTPIGPIQLDLAFNVGVLAARGPIADLLRNQYEEPPVRLHLTLGNLW